MEYKILESDNVMVDNMTALPTEKLTKAVNEAIKEGWKPLGGVAVYQEEDLLPTYAQALIKED